MTKNEEEQFNIWWEAHKDDEEILDEYEYYKDDMKDYYTKPLPFKKWGKEYWDYLK